MERVYTHRLFKGGSGPWASDAVCCEIVLPLELPQSGMRCLAEMPIST